MIRRIESNERIGKTTLPSGVRIITESIQSVRSVSVGAWVYAGSRDEAPGEEGICHFIEHMVFKGTGTRRMHQIAGRMESVGGYLNAFTAKEYTCFLARALDEHLDRAVDIVCDLVSNPVFPEKELAKEKEVVIEEMRMYEDTPEEYAFDLLEGAIYGDHPMGRPIIGNEESVRSFTTESLFHFLDRHYTPERLVIAAAGNVDHDRVVRMVERALEGSSRINVEISGTPVPEYTPARRQVEKPIQQAHLFLGTRGVGVHHPSRVAVSVLNTILGGGMSSFLNQNIREKYGYCYSVYSFANMYGDCGEFGVYMGTDASKLDRAEDLIFRELDRMVKKTVSPRRFRQAINQVKGSIMLGLESMSSRMTRIARQELYYDRFYSLDEIMEQIESVTAADVQSVAAQLLNRSKFSVVRLVPRPT